MASDNLFDVVEELKQITADLRRTVYGDPATRSRGLMSEFDAMRQEVGRIDAELQKVKSRRPNPWSWTVGYMAFLASGAFAIVAFYSFPGVQAALDLPGPVAMGLALLFAAAALVLFIAGFGWFERQS